MMTFLATRYENMRYNRETGATWVSPFLAGGDGDLRPITVNTGCPDKVFPLIKACGVRREAASFKGVK